MPVCKQQNSSVNTSTSKLSKPRKPLRKPPHVQTLFTSTMHRRRHTTTTTRRPTFFNRLVHPTTTPRRRGATAAGLGAGTAAGPMGTHRVSRTKPTLGARIHGMAKRVLGGVTGNRRKKQAGKSYVLILGVNKKYRTNILLFQIM